MNKVSSCRVKSEGVKKVVKWLEEPDFPANFFHTSIHGHTVSGIPLVSHIRVSTLKDHINSNNHDNRIKEARLMVTFIIQTFSDGFANDYLSYS